MIQGPLVMLQSILEAAICRRRALASVCDECKIQVDISSQMCPEPLPDLHQSSDDTGRSTDASGEEQVADSFDGSDADDSDVMPNSEPTTGSSDGSDAESSGTDTPGPTWHRNRARRTLPRSGSATRLNPHAAAFVPATAVLEPTQQQASPLRGSIRSVIEALEQWEASDAAEDHFHYLQDQSGPDTTVQSATSIVLQNALSSLTPDATAMVRALVDFKLAS